MWNLPLYRKFQDYFCESTQVQCKNVYFSVPNEAMWDMEQVHSGVCEIGLLGRVPALAMEPLHFCCTASGVILKDMGEIKEYQNSIE